MSRWEASREASDSAARGSACGAEGTGRGTTRRWEAGGGTSGGGHHLQRSPSRCPLGAARLCPGGWRLRGGLAWEPVVTMSSSLGSYWSRSAAEMTSCGKVEGVGSGGAADSVDRGAAQVWNGHGRRSRPNPHAQLAERRAGGCVHRKPAVAGACGAPPQARRCARPRPPSRRGAQQARRRGGTPGAGPGSGRTLGSKGARPSRAAASR